MTAAELEGRLREWARLSMAPLRVPDPDQPPSPAELDARLREVTGLWRATAELGLLAPGGPATSTAPPAPGDP